MVNRPKAIGTAAETAVARYLQANGFPDAERIALHGNLDQGDVVSRGLVWEVKGGKAAETASDAQVAAWLAETEVERRNRGADHGVLVMKRAGKGAANAGLWWAVVSGTTFAVLAGCRSYDVNDRITDDLRVRVTLAEATRLLAPEYGTRLDSTL